MPTDIQPVPSPPMFRRLWVVSLLTGLVVTFPIAMIALLSGNVYRKKNGIWHPIGNGPRYVYGGLLALWLVAAIARVAMQPGGLKQEWAKSADPDLPATQQQAAATAASTDQAGLSACDSSEATDAVKSSLENGAASKLVDVKVLDFGQAKETIFERDRNIRRCVAVAALNTGQTIVTYQVYLGPSGKQLVQVQTGQQAEMQYELDKDKKKEIENAGKPADCDPQIDNLTGKKVYHHYDNCPWPPPADDETAQPEKPAEATAEAQSADQSSQPAGNVQPQQNAPGNGNTR